MSSSPASSSAVSPSSPVPSPFSTLPTELIQSIIESSVPHSFQSTTYTYRQATLRSLCLVCKLFHEIAKPLLLAIVFLKKRRNDMHLNVPRDIHRHYCRTAVFWFDFRRNNELPNVFAGFRHLHQLTISRIWELDLEAISYLSDSMSYFRRAFGDTSVSNFGENHHTDVDFPRIILGLHTSGKIPESRLRDFFEEFGNSSHHSGKILSTLALSCLILNVVKVDYRH